MSNRKHQVTYSFESTVWFFSKDSDIHLHCNIESTRSVSIMIPYITSEVPYNSLRRFLFQ